jgi:hypothetical protein
MNLAQLEELHRLIWTLPPLMSYEDGEIDGESEDDSDWEWDEDEEEDGL